MIRGWQEAELRGGRDKGVGCGKRRWRGPEIVRDSGMESLIADCQWIGEENKLRRARNSRRGSYIW